MADPVDLAMWTFETLRAEFFGGDLEPRRFRLRPKAHTQDDPFDEFVRERLEAHVPPDLHVLGATGPLISPDIVVASRAQLGDLRRGEATLDPRRVVGVEVKKLNRSKSGRVARPGGLDFNTTPPCRSVTVYRDDKQLEIPGFYLFACLEGRGSNCRVTALVLCDGGALDESTREYRRAVGQREKRIGIGSYGDGLDRERPMFVFPNPLGWRVLDHEATLIHRRADLESRSLAHAGRIHRHHLRTPRKRSTYHVYRVRRDLAPGFEPLNEVNPFPAPARRTKETQPRGRFTIRTE